jgi:Uma2 family endonuclease
MTNLEQLVSEIEALSPEDRISLERQYVSGDLIRLKNNVIASNVSLEDYMEHYAADHCEWVEGYVIKMSPSSIEHTDLLKYLVHLLDAFFELRPIGRLIVQPFVMRLPAFPRRRREPDLLIVLNSNPHKVERTYMDGPADICIEIVSEESIQRDHGDKFDEYEQGGVPEYWILDPLRNEARFYRLNETGRYIRQSEDAQGNYRTPALHGLAVHVPTLWQEQFPGPVATGAIVQAMLADHD